MGCNGESGIIAAKQRKLASEAECRREVCFGFNGEGGIILEKRSVLLCRRISTYENSNQ